MRTRFLDFWTPPAFSKGVPCAKNAALVTHDAGAAELECWCTRRSTCGEQACQRLWRLLDNFQREIFQHITLALLLRSPLSVEFLLNTVYKYPVSLSWHGNQLGVQSYRWRSLVLCSSLFSALRARSTGCWRCCLFESGWYQNRKNTNFST